MHAHLPEAASAFRKRKLIFMYWDSVSRNRASMLAAQCCAKSFNRLWQWQDNPTTIRSWGNNNRSVRSLSDPVYSRLFDRRHSNDTHADRWSYAGAAFASNLIAPTLGRVPLSCFTDATDRLVVRSPIYCMLNRNYVTPPMRDLARALAEHMDREFPGTVTVVLDANFPFIDGFPLLPHLSHADGKKLDLAFYYKDVAGTFLNGATRSPIGYFAFEQPAAGDEQPCEGRSDWLTTRWNLDALQPLFPAYRIEEQRTASAIRWSAQLRGATHSASRD